MGTFAHAHGFVLQYRLAPERDETAPVVRHAERDGTAFGSRFRVLVRPFPTTPEAVRERQPIATPLTVLAYAGRIDNREDVADRLGRPRLRRATDGELMAEAYAAWGPEFPEKVLGEYSFALVERPTGRLVAARDNLGIGRLFHYEDADKVWLASSLALLLDALPAWPPLDRQSLAEYFATGAVLSSGRTIYQGIRELPAAHVLIRHNDRATLRRYWQPDPERRVSLRSDGDYDDAMRSLLFEATRAALRSNTPVWSDLSGGLDSSTVTAVATLLDRSGCGPVGGVSAYSLVMSQTTASDEGHFQKEFIAAHPLPHHTLDADAYPCFAALDNPPSCHPSKGTLYTSLLNASAELFKAHGVRARLTGKGGDVVFCGDHFPPLHLADLARRLKWGPWLREMRQWARQGERSFANLLWHCSRNRLTDPYAGRPNGDVPNWVPAEFTAAVRRAESAPWSTGPRLYDSPARELFYRSVVQISSHGSDSVGDERSPLLYRPLVEFVLALPWEHLLRPGQDRVIQRRALRGILPEPIRLRDTKATATHLLLRGFREGWPKIQEVTHGRRIAELELVEPSAFHAACERLRHGLSGRHLRYFVAALSLEMWLKANEAYCREEVVQTFFSSPTPRLMEVNAMTL